MRRFWLCADDYGIAPGVNRAIRDLIARGRINAASVMVTAPGFSAAEARALDDLLPPGFDVIEPASPSSCPRLSRASTSSLRHFRNQGVDGREKPGHDSPTDVDLAGTPFSRKQLPFSPSVARRAAIGLHFTLTAPFQPAAEGYRPSASDGAFLRLPATFARGLLRGLDPRSLAAEAERQFALFRAAFGRPPDFVDGHQHVQLLPQVGDALLAIMPKAAPDAWIRQCGSALPLARRWRLRKGLLLDMLSARLRARCAACGIPTNPAFAGTYDFARDNPYETLFATFLSGLPDGGLVMCHPGLVDAQLARLDSLTVLREREHAFLAGERFPALLAQYGIALA